MQFCYLIFPITCTSKFLILQVLVSGASCDYLFERIRYPSLPFANAFDPLLQDYPLLHRGLDDYPLIPAGIEDYPLLDEGLEDYTPSERELDVLPFFDNAKKRSSKKYASAVYSAESASPSDYSAESASAVKYYAQPASPVDHSELSRNLEQYLGPAWSLAGKLILIFLFGHQSMIIFVLV
jgi:hypothetical protein